MAASRQCNNEARRENGGIFEIYRRDVSEQARAHIMKAVANACGGGEAVAFLMSRVGFDGVNIWYCAGK